jgi:hypothetical protein
MKDTIKYYFSVDQDYNQQELIDLYNNTPKNWSYYGPKSKNTLWILPIDNEIFYKTDLGNLVNSEYVDSVAFMRIKAKGRVSPHVDTRATSFLFPLIGDFNNSVLNFYDNYRDKKTFELINKDESIASTAVIYTVDDASFSLTYTGSVIINSRIIHSVNNFSDTDRVNFNITLKRDLTYNDVLELYQQNKLLKLQ